VAPAAASAVPDGAPIIDRRFPRFLWAAASSRGRPRARPRVGPCRDRAGFARAQSPRNACAPDSPAPARRTWTGA